MHIFNAKYTQCFKIYFQSYDVLCPFILNQNFSTHFMIMAGRILTTNGQDTLKHTHIHTQIWTLSTHKSGKQPQRQATESGTPALEDTSEVVSSDLFPGRRIPSTFLLTVSLDFCVEALQASRFLPNKPFYRQGLHSLLLSSLTSQRSFQESDDCLHGTLSLIFRLPFSRAFHRSGAPRDPCPCHLGQVPCHHIV